MTAASVGPMSPFFVVTDVGISIGFYRDRLGFNVIHAEGAPTPFFAILHREAAMLFVKSEDGIAPTPNPGLHRHLPWDAYCYTAEPEALAAEFAARGATFSRPLENNSSGLRGFELTDPDGYVLFFGRPMEAGER